MVKRLFWVAVGAVGALQADKWLQEQKARFRPSALTGTALDKINAKLEQSRAAQSGSASAPSGHPSR